ncbi:DNA-binding beta-propeller fold protein YncE [Dyadobacter sp. BE34]|uniref:DNA-binding beta-propeller fold protein YncE n=1 Tax=Dyadobacter fermentans TaxID=94254 RepID=A0ABU1RAJ4_9BACT|nr:MULTISPECIES: SdiA-regulated domain-containing protein [Dyadobacter]MDR6809605.1 DNA-binding beta-propeller fold protein YncE [Dyadobacter fermentans]MDR7047283.1 DNA-binding beta-propeller fold protein YncE [Dyadobacter sp. BE242]MDR7201519.1 DNA-binding beta-propeller fold protein YncE [Dyadobacter sp. BE34]MDR7219389.1 DNA-binding beta-propeller fold protein YncE [Dyadobacter sp. BE31]MDR7267217.1 DNA-binding beta-propeller fold protein YncE [Dyadobacter sp. BE32]
MRNVYKFSLLLIWVVILNCETSKKREVSQTADLAVNNSLKHYNLDKPQKFNMPESLLEISGIAFRDQLNDTIYAINDEEGKIFRLGWNVRKQLNSKFGKHGDYEDVSIVGGTAYVLKSNGTLYSFPFDSANSKKVNEVNEIKNVLPKGEYEGMYADRLTNSLYVLCKNCSVDHSAGTASGYIIKLDNFPAIMNSFRIDLESIADSRKNVKDGLRPSGLAKNPLSGEWYVISAARKLLIVTDSSWKIKGTFSLNSNLFNQPEGIAFDKFANLYISNEGDDITNGNILRFNRQ